LVGGIAGGVTDGDPFQAGLFAGQVFAVILCTLLALTIAYKKAVLLSPKPILLVIASLILSILIGALGGLIPIAYLTTYSSENT